MENAGGDGINESFLCIICLCQTCASAILGSLNPAPYWKYFFQMLFRLFQSWKSQILAKHAWIANWQYLLVLFFSLNPVFEKLDCRKSVFLDVVLFPQCCLVLPRQVCLSSAVILSVRFFVRLTYMWVILGHSNRPFFFYTIK